MSRVLLSRMRVSANGIVLQVSFYRGCCCRILDRLAKARVHDRCRLVSLVGRLSSVGRRFDRVGSTFTSIGVGNCKMIDPGGRRVRLSRPMVVGRKDECKMGVHSRTPSVRVVHTGVRARVTPVIKDRGRTRSLITCVGGRDRNPRNI